MRQIILLDAIRHGLFWDQHYYYYYSTINTFSVIASHIAWPGYQATSIYVLHAHTVQKVTCRHLTSQELITRGEILVRSCV